MQKSHEGGLATHISCAVAAQPECRHPLGPHAASHHPLAAYAYRLSSLSSPPHGRHHARQEPDAVVPLVRSVEGVMSDHDPYSDCRVRGLSRVVFSLPCFLLVMNVPCRRGAVPEHPRDPTRTGGTASARHPPPEMVQVSAGRDGAVRPPWIPRNRPRAALAGALTRSAASYEVDARSLPPTVATRPGGSVWRGGSAPQ